MTETVVDRRSVLQYAVGFDLVIIAVGIALLLPAGSGMTLVPFIAAVALATARSGWRVGLATTAFSLTALLLIFETLVPLLQMGMFAFIGVAASLLLDRSRAPEPDPADVEGVVELSTFTRARAIPALMHFGLPLLALVVYLNLSNLFVENYSLPSILQPLILVLAGLVVHYREAFRPLATLLRPLTLALIAYCLVVFASSNWARSVSEADGALTELIKSLLLMLVAGSLAASWRALRGTLVVVACGAALLCMLQMVQVATGDRDLRFGGLAGVDEGHIFGDVSELRPAGPVGDPNYYARILVLAFPAAAFLGIGRRSRREQAFWIAAAGLIALGILFTYSRGGMLTLGAVVLLLVLVRRLPVNPVTVGIGVIGLIALIPTNVGQRFLTIESLFESDQMMDASTEKRKQLLAVGWQIFADHPVAGVGAGNFGAHYPSYANLVGLTSLDFTAMGVRQYPHNLYLEMGIETGLIGLATFGGAMFIALAGLFRARRTLLARGEHGHAALVTAIAFAIIGYLLASLFLHAGYPRYLWMFLGLAAAAIGLTEDVSREARPT
ncbi:MAG TPA: O-antigen ligase family protein [Thermoanaerobaculia bacterium]